MTHHHYGDMSNLPISYANNICDRHLIIYHNNLLAQPKWLTTCSISISAGHSNGRLTMNDMCKNDRIWLA